ncbi:MAG: hypothetical protein WC854_02090 [Bacteroidales bacterium]
MIVLTGLLYSCSGNISDYADESREPQIEPDYSDITIPPNIAPLNFMINEIAEKYKVHFYSLAGEGIIVTSTDKKIKIPAGKWGKILALCKGGDLFIDIYVKQEGGWKKFETIINQVANEPIDSYLVYRIFDQGFEAWNKMGIYQRCLENFEEYPIMINDMSEGNCMNCHSFNKNNSNTMLFHMREKMAGTVIYKNGNITKVNTKTDQTISPGIFPAWHPDGRYIAFSLNHNPVIFNAIHNKLRETVDTLSDLILYDTETNIIYNYPEIASKDKFETFPSWSPDGNYLYFCSANALPFSKFKEICYDLLRIAFNPDNRQFGTVDTVVSASSNGLSTSFPRISPDGKYLLFCLLSYGNFSIWNSDSDLYIKDLETGEIFMPGINSNQSESYHTWSSDGRWIVFSSKRLDGFGTLPYFTYFDQNGTAHKPFLLPQKNPEFYNTFLKSYNVPELVTSKVLLTPRDFSEIIKSEPINASFENNK